MSSIRLPSAVENLIHVLLYEPTNTSIDRLLFCAEILSKSRLTTSEAQAVFDAIIICKNIFSLHSNEHKKMCQLIKALINQKKKLHPKIALLDSGPNPQVSALVHVLLHPFADINASYQFRSQEGSAIHDQELDPDTKAIIVIAEELVTELNPLEEFLLANSTFVPLIVITDSTNVNHPSLKRRINFHQPKKSLFESEENQIAFAYIILDLITR